MEYLFWAWTCGSVDMRYCADVIRHVGTVGVECSRVLGCARKRGAHEWLELLGVSDNDLNN